MLLKTIKLLFTVVLQYILMHKIHFNGINIAVSNFKAKKLMVLIDRLYKSCTVHQEMVVFLVS